MASLKLGAVKRHDAAHRQRAFGVRRPQFHGNGEWPLSQQAVYVDGAGSENECIDPAEDEQRDGDIARCKEWRSRLRGAQYAVHGPGLTADLSRKPTGKRRDET